MEQTPLHYAAREGCTAAIQALLAIVPSLPFSHDEEGWLPAHSAAGSGQVAALQQLLAAAPSAVTAVTDDGETLLGLAAANGCVEAVRLLLQLAPETACADNLAALRAALASREIEAARCLLGYGSTHAVLSCLAAVTGSTAAAAQPLFVEAVAARLPLAPDEWQLVPDACPGLGMLLPQALALSFEQARQLVVRHLPPADAGRLRAGAQALARTQRVRRVYLPLPLTHRILSLCLT